MTNCERCLREATLEGVCVGGGGRGGGLIYV